MPKLIVIADDLTGANDTGAQFANCGIATLVMTDLGFSFESLDGWFEVIVVDTESRHCGAGEAAAKVTAVVRRAREAGIGHFYKKTDSTLRGNLGSELQALLQASGSEALAFIPACPELGRITRGGHHYLGTTPINKTAFAADPLNPITESYIPALLAQQTNLPSIVIDRNTRDFSTEGLSGAILVFDAERESDLNEIGEWLQKRGLLTAMAGASGFAQHLPRLINFKTEPVRKPALPSRMLIVNGSLNEVSLKQIAEAQASGLATVRLTPEMLIDEHDLMGLVDEIVRLDEQGKDVLIHSVTQRGEVKSYQEAAAKFGADASGLHERIAERTAQLVEMALAKTGFELLTVFGGDTLAAICRAMKWDRMQPCAELMPGIVLASITSEDDQKWLITKAGGFGPVDVLLKLKEQLKKV